MSDRIVRAAWGLALLACAAQTAAYLINELLLDGRFPRLDVSSDASVFAVLNTVVIGALAALAVAAGLAGAVSRLRAVLLALGLAVLALDDATGFHDRVNRLRAAWLPGPPRVAAGVAAAAFACVLALVFVLFWYESRRAEPGAGLLIRAGLLSLAAALAVRVVGVAFDVEETFSGALRALGIAAEQGLDLCGWILLGCGVLAMLRRPAVDQSSSPLPHWPALTASVGEKPRAASMTAPTLPDGAAKTRRLSL